MITIYICMALGVALGIFAAYDDYFSGFWSYFWNSVLGVFFGSIVGFIIAVALPAKTEIRPETYSLVNLQDNNATGGGMFLGTGHIEGRMQYVFYYESGDGYRMMQVDYKKALVKDTDKNPECIVYSIHNTDSWVNWFAVDLFGCPTYEIRIPQGTIKTNYNLDAQ